jgi:putative CocE/NonD family hydrolase
MPDGVVLRADVYRDPAADEPRPTLLQYTAYNKSNWASVNGVINPERAVDQGFVVVVVDARARFRSGGDQPFRPFADAAEDTAAAVNWAAAQPWSNGRVGMYGASNNGVPQWQALRRKPDALVTIVPHFTASEFDEGWVWRGGAFNLGFNLWWSLANLAPDQQARAQARGTAPTDGSALHAALADPAREFARWSLADVPALERIAPHYREWVEHKPGDPYWAEFSARDAMTTTDRPVLHVAGWFNVHLDGNLNNYLAIKAAGGVAAQRQRLIIGPWTQWSPALFGDTCGPQRRFPSTFDMEGTQLAWFAHHLADGPDPALPPVRLFVMGADVWRDEPEWPPPSAVATEWYLHSGGAANSRSGDGALDRTAPGSGEGADRFVYDPHDPVPSVGGATYLPNPAGNSGPMDQGAVEDRQDVLVYSSAVLTEPVEVTGPVVLRLFVQSSAPATDITAKLVDVSPDGRADLLCDGIRRLQASDLAPRADAGGPIEVEVDLIATSNLFRTGHRIRLEVSSSNFPKFDRHPNTASGRASSDAEAVPATQTVHHSAAYPSHLVLPVVRPVAAGAAGTGTGGIT